MGPRGPQRGIPRAFGGLGHRPGMGQAPGRGGPHTKPTSSSAYGEAYSTKKINPQKTPNGAFQNIHCQTVCTSWLCVIAHPDHWIPKIPGLAPSLPLLDPQLRRKGLPAVTKMGRWRPQGTRRLQEEGTGLLGHCGPMGRHCTQRLTSGL